MDVQDKAHATANLTIGVTAILSPFLIKAIDITEYVLHFLTVLGGFILVVYQLKSMYDKKK